MKLDHPYDLEENIPLTLFSESNLNWGERRDSNPRPSESQSDALTN